MNVYVPGFVQAVDVLVVVHAVLAFATAAACATGPRYTAKGVVLLKNTPTLTNSAASPQKVARVFK
jgi:hypothetical protein